VTTTQASDPVTAAVALSPNATLGIVAAAPVQTEIPGASPPAAPTENPTPPALQTLVGLLFSPLGFVVVTALVLIGALSLWAAFLLGQRTRPRPEQPSPEAIPEEYTLRTENSSETAGTPAGKN
jgi:hypothetical protein